VGALDDDLLFFLRSRGIPAAQARAMLVEAFVTEAVEAVEDATIREAALGALRAWWRAQGVPMGEDAA
jgi:Fe-S cluster assembly protein SufD